MILNKASYFRIQTCGAAKDSPIRTPGTFQIENDSMLFHLRSFLDASYWLVDIARQDSFDEFPLNTLMPASILQKIKNREVQLLLFNSHEAYHSIVDGIYRTCVIEHDIPVEQVTLLSESYDILDEVRAISKKYNLGEIKVEWMLEFEINAKRQKEIILQQNTSDLITLVDKPYEKKFLSFNLNLNSRIHRPGLLSLLCIRNLLDKGYISAGFDKWAEPWSRLIYGVRTLFQDDPVTSELIAANEHRILNIGKLSLDSKTEKDHAYLTTDTDYLYRDTYFSVVTETNGFQWPPLAGPWGGETGAGRLVSEKTFKPIAQRHPFILVGIPNSLDLLRELGYKTFHPWIDESYNSELNDAKRIIMVADEIERLCNLAPPQLTEFLDGVREICDYNYTNLMSKKVWTYKLN